MPMPLTADNAIAESATVRCCDRLSALFSASSDSLTPAYGKRGVAAVLLAAGTKGKRYALPNSRIMIHQGSGGFRGNAPDALIQMKEWEFLVNRNIEILARHTSQAVDKVRQDTNRDYFMAPEDAKDYGIIDAVYSEQWDSLTAQHHDEKAAEAEAAGEDEAEPAPPEPKRSSKTE